MQGKMKALVKDKKAPGAVLKEIAIPQLGHHDILVKVLATAICGTDLHIYNWDRWAASRVKPPLVIGHEMAGEVVEIGPAVESCCVGDYVSLECHKPCGRCYQCRTGQAHICRDYAILGVDFNGCFAEFVSVPEYNIWKNSTRLAPEIACLQDPFGNAVLTALSSEIVGKNVMVTGCGPIGLFAIGIAKVSGASRIFAVDRNDYRLNLAKKMGAKEIINPQQECVSAKILSLTRGCGVDVVLEMSGSEQCLHDGLKVVKNGGRVFLLGIFEDKVQLELSQDIIFKGITITGVTGRKIYNTWYTASALLNNVLDISPVITHKLKLTEFEEAFRLMNSWQCGKIILYP